MWILVVLSHLRRAMLTLAIRAGRGYGEVSVGPLCTILSRCYCYEDITCAMFVVQSCFCPMQLVTTRREAFVCFETFDDVFPVCVERFGIRAAPHGDLGIPSQ